MNSNNLFGRSYSVVASMPVIVAILAIGSGSAGAGTIDLPPMDGTETIDPNEQISGNAVVGVRFLIQNKNQKSDLDKKDTFDLDNVYVYFPRKPATELSATLTTVDGRYHFVASLSIDRLPEELRNGDWGRLFLRNSKGGKPLDKAFLGRYLRHGEIAILVTDEAGRIYPARWGEDSTTETLEIMVNAEGADAYFVRSGNGKPELVRCNETGQNSRFKFDHDCDMSWKDALKMSEENQDYEFPIIRKRGATYDSQIDIKLARPEK